MAANGRRILLTGSRNTERSRATLILQSGINISLVISAHGFEDGTGLDLQRWITQENNTLFVLFSGSDFCARRADTPIEFPVLRKPFDLRRLRDIVYKLLSE